MQYVEVDNLDNINADLIIDNMNNEYNNVRVTKMKEKEMLEKKMMERQKTLFQGFRIIKSDKTNSVKQKLKNLLSKRFVLNENDYHMLIHRYRLDSEKVTREKIVDLIIFLNSQKNYIINNNNSFKEKSINYTYDKDENKYIEKLVKEREQFLGSLNVSKNKENKGIENNNIGEEYFQNLKMDEIQLIEKNTEKNTEKNIEKYTENKNLNSDINENKTKIVGFQESKLNSNGVSYPEQSPYNIPVTVPKYESLPPQKKNDEQKDNSNVLKNFQEELEKRKINFDNSITQNILDPLKMINDRKINLEKKISNTRGNSSNIKMEIKKKNFQNLSVENGNLKNNLIISENEMNKLKQNTNNYEVINILTDILPGYTKLGIFKVNISFKDSKIEDIMNFELLSCDINKNFYDKNNFKNFPYLILKIDQIPNKIYLNNSKIGGFSQLMWEKKNNFYRYFNSDRIFGIHKFDKKGFSLNDLTLSLYNPDGDIIDPIQFTKKDKFNITFRIKKRKKKENLKSIIEKKQTKLSFIGDQNEDIVTLVDKEKEKENKKFQSLKNKNINKDFNPGLILLRDDNEDDDDDSFEFLIPIKSSENDTIIKKSDKKNNKKKKIKNKIIPKKEDKYLIDLKSQIDKLQLKKIEIGLKINKQLEITNVKGRWLEILNEDTKETIYYCTITKRIKKELPLNWVKHMKERYGEKKNTSIPQIF